MPYREQSKRKPAAAFHAFHQRAHDWAAIEKALIKKQLEYRPEQRADKEDNKE